MQHETTSTLDRQALMETFLKGVPTEELLNHDINSWYAHKAQEQAEEMRDEMDSPAGGLLKFLSSGPMSGMAAMMFAREFKDTPAKNYYELVYQLPEMGAFTVTIQRNDGETPALQLAAAKDRIAMLEESHAQVIQARDLYKQSWQLSSLQSMLRSFREAVRAARKVWLDENDPKDGTDCVTPFDQFLYTEVISGEGVDLPDLFELMEWAKYPADGRDLNSVAKGKMSRLILAATGLGDASLTVSDR